MRQLRIRTALAAALGVGLFSGATLGANYSATGTHQCRAASGETYSCVVTGSFFGNCVEATSSLQTQDCCPSSRACKRDKQGGKSKCESGGSSVTFSLNYCAQNR
jgi:hypothetical protein